MSKSNFDLSTTRLFCKVKGKLIEVHATSQTGIDAYKKYPALIPIAKTKKRMYSDTGRAMKYIAYAFRRKLPESSSSRLFCKFRGQTIEVHTTSQAGIDAYNQYPTLIPIGKTKRKIYSPDDPERKFTAYAFTRVS